jgi:hypothetical protein
MCPVLLDQITARDLCGHLKSGEARVKQQKRIGKQVSTPKLAIKRKYCS